MFWGEKQSLFIARQYRPTQHKYKVNKSYENTFQIFLSICSKIYVNIN